MTAGHLAPAAPDPAVDATAGPGPGTPTPTDWDLLVVLMGAPYADDGVSTALRWVESVARAGGRVQVWTCGYATLLTQRALGESKPRDVLGTTSPPLSSAAWVDSLIASSSGRARWLSCRYCSEERGATDHVDAVRVRPATAFHRHVGESAKTVVAGVI